MNKEISVANEDAMMDFGRVFSNTLQAPMAIYLHGDLGAGKTTLVRGVLRGLGFDDVVKSPTYTIVESYEFPDKKMTIFHFDLYRFNSSVELMEMGYDDYLNENSVCFIEWPERASDYLAQADIDCYIEDQEQNSRLLKLSSNTQEGERVLRIL